MTVNEILLLVVGVAAGMGIAAFLFFVARPVKPRRRDNPKSAPAPKKQPAPAPAAARPTASSPKFPDVTHSEFEVSKSADEIKVRIKGVDYHRLEDIPDPALRQQAEEVLRDMPSLESLPHRMVIEPSGGAEDHQIRVGNMTYPNVDAIPDAAIRQQIRDWMRNNPTAFAVPRHGRVVIERENGRIRIEVDGAVYHNLAEIPDAALRDMIANALQQFPR